MELFQLQYFVAVVEEGNFTRAAARCHISQPALSQQIQKLERECGTQLLDRSSRRVRVTPAGKALYEKARTILALATDMFEEVQQHSAYGSGRAVLGAIPTVAPYLLPELLTEFRRSFPEAEVIVHEDLTENLLAACRSGEVDLAIMAEPVDEPGLKVQALGSEPLLLALPSDHPLARKRAASLRQLEREPFVLISEVHCLGRQILELCTREGYNPTVRCQSAQLLTVQRLVEAGMGISLIPEMATRSNVCPGVVYRRIARQRPERTLVVVRHEQRPQSGAVLALLDAVIAHCQKRLAQAPTRP